MTLALATFDANTPTTTIVTALNQDGGVIIADLVDPAVMDVVYDEIRANSEAADRESGTALWPDGNKTLGGLARVSPTFANTLLTHPKLLDVADGILLPMAPMGSRATDGNPTPNVHKLGLLDVAENDAGSTQLVYRAGDAKCGPNCHHYTLGAAVLLERGPGGDNQPLHRENAIYQPWAGMVANLPEYILSTMWAGTDFDRHNGATRLVPGSHRWPEARIAGEAEIAQAVMPKGSVVLWLSRTLHGAGVSTVDDGRVGFFHSYIADWFRQEENQYLAVPAEVAQDLVREARQLIGYRSSPSLGWVKGRSADDLLAPGESSPI